MMGKVPASETSLNNNIKDNKQRVNNIYVNTLVMLQTRVNHHCTRYPLKTLSLCKETSETLDPHDVLFYGKISMTRTAEGSDYSLG